MSEPLLVARHLFKSYRSGLRRLEVLADLDLSVTAASEAVAIVGDSGVGKSTLLHILGGLDRPDAGEVLFRGQELGRASAQDLATYRNRHVGFVFQFHHLLPEFTALENTEMPLRIGRMPPASRQEASNLLERLGLADRMNHHPGALSGGEQQRVAVARALAARPSIVFADEPTGNLDPRTGAEVFRALRELQTERVFAMVLVSHNERLARGCDRVLRLYGGRLHALDERETRDYFEGLGAGVTADPML